MKFENDIFISYAHDDNGTYDTKDEGWVDEFHRCLAQRIAQVSGKKPKIWRDKKLRGNDYFDDEIENQLPKTAILISVFSPGYLNSKWCLRELESFCQKSENKRFGNKSRVFKVVKLPIERDQLPSEVQRLLGYEFHTKAPPPFIELTPTMEDLKRQYVQVLTDLANSISETLKTLHTLESFPPEKLVVSKHNTEGLDIPHKEFQDDEPSLLVPVCHTIYLAMTTSDLKEKRNKIRRELEQHGHTVLPEEELPDFSPDFEDAVRQNLAQAQLSVHLLGNRYGPIPAPAEYSMVELQYRLALAHQQSHQNFDHMVWLPEEIEPQDDSQKTLITAVQNDSECLQTSLEELKTIIQVKLQPRPKDLPKGKILLSDGPSLIYLIHDQKDQAEDIEPLYDYLVEQNLDVMLPDFSGNDADVRMAHQKSLEICDAAILLYGKGDHNWLQIKLRELNKAIGYGREKPMIAKAVYVAEPKTTAKELFKTPQADVIRDFAEFSPELLAPFLAKIAASLGG